MQVCDVKEKIIDKKIDEVRSEFNLVSYKLWSVECDTIKHEEEDNKKKEAI
jgi:hypothetical protein